MDNPFTTAGISSVCSNGCFQEALFNIVTADHYGLTTESDNEELRQCEFAIRTRCHVIIILRISRPSPTGDELDIIGFIEEKPISSRILFWTSDASCDVDYIQVSPIESTLDGLTQLMRKLGANLCQISGTEIVNFRPDLLSRQNLTAVIDQVIEDTGDDWADFFANEVKTTGDFLSRNYREQ